MRVLAANRGVCRIFPKNQTPASACQRSAPSACGSYEDCVGECARAKPALPLAHDLDIIRTFAIASAGTKQDMACRYAGYASIGRKKRRAGDRPPSASPPFGRYIHRAELSCLMLSGAVIRHDRKRDDQQFSRCGVWCDRCIAKADEPTHTRRSGAVFDRADRSDCFSAAGG